MRISTQMLETYQNAYNDSDHIALRIHMRTIALELYGKPFLHLFPSQQRQVVGNYIYRATILKKI